MKKIALLSIMLLSTFVFAAFPMANSQGTIPLKFDVTPYKVELEGAYGESSIGGYAVTERTPFWVDMVDAEAYANGGDGIYVAVLDTGLMGGWWNYLPAGSVMTGWGIGFTHDITWNSGINDFEMGPLHTRSYITNSIGSYHGTHVTSTLIGFYRTSTLFVRGVAPKVKIIPVLALDTWLVDCPDPYYPGCYGGKVRFRGGTDEMVCAGIRYIADLAEEEGIKIIINMSLGASAPSEMEEEAVDYAISKGVIIVASAGNRGEAGMGWPGAYPQVISAAAGGWTEGWITRPPEPRWYLNDVPEKLNTKDVWGNNWQMFLEDFSSRPNKDLGQNWKDLDVCTPGAAVVGPFKDYIYWSGTAWVNPAFAFYYLWGTSMAAPHVSGIAAIVAQYYPYLCQSDMEWALKKGAVRLPLASDGAYALDSTPWLFYWNDHDYGSGWLTADNALFGAFIVTEKTY